MDGGSVKNGWLTLFLWQVCGDIKEMKESERPHSILSRLSSLLDFSTARDPRIALTLAANFFAYLSVHLPYIFLPGRATNIYADHFFGNSSLHNLQEVQITYK